MKPAVERAAPGYRREFLQAIDAALVVSPKARPSTVADWRPKLLAGAPLGGSGFSTPILPSPPTQAMPSFPPLPGSNPSSRPPSERPVSTPPFPTAHGLHSAPPPPAVPPPVSAVGARTRSPWPMRLGIGGGITAAALAGAFFLLRPSNDQMADAELSKILFSTDIKAFEDLQKRYPNTNASKRAEARVADLKRAARHAAAANDWARIKDGSDEAALEQFIKDHADAPVVADAKARLAEVKRQKAVSERHRLAEQEWHRIRSTGDIAAVQKFLQTYGDTPLAGDARARIAELQGKAKLAEAEEEWNRIKSTDVEASLESFISRHADSPHVGEARSRLALLKERKDRDERASREWAQIKDTTNVQTIDNFLFKFNDTKAAVEARQRKATLLASVGERERQAAAEWTRIRFSADIAGVQRFLQTYGDTQVAADARTRLAELQKRERLAEAEAEWNRIRSTDIEASLESFINRHGDSPQATEARTRLATLRQGRLREERAAQQWAILKSSTDISAINNFLSTYGDTRVAAEARQRKASLEAASNTANEADLADCRQGNDHDRRIRGCTALISSRSHLAEAYGNRAIAHYAKNNTTQSLADLEEAIRINPREPIFFANRGVARISLRQHDLAIKDFDQAIQLNPSYAFAYFQRGRAHNDQKNWDRAIEDFGHSIRLRPDSKAYEERGYARLSKNDLVGALSDYSEAIKLDPLSHIAFNGRGVAYERQGRRSEALEAYRKAVSLNQNFEVGRNNLNRLQSQTNTNKNTNTNQTAKKKDDSKHTGTDQSVTVPQNNNTNTNTNTNTNSNTNTNTNTNKRGPSTGTN